jgi:hypothetical protein
MAKDWKEFERNVAKHLGLWWGCVFRRTPSSGAWGTMSHRMSHDTDFHGDIVAPPNVGFPFSVECKVYKQVELYLALYGTSNVFSWWDQCVADAVRVHKWPMLIMRENQKKALVVLSKKLWDKLALQLPNGEVVMSLSWKSGTVRRDVVILALHVFTATCPASRVRQK